MDGWWIATIAPSILKHNSSHLVSRASILQSLTLFPWVDLNFVPEVGRWHCLLCQSKLLRMDAICPRASRVIRKPDPWICSCQKILARLWSGASSGRTKSLVCTRAAAIRPRACYQHTCHLSNRHCISISRMATWKALFHVWTCGVFKRLCSPGPGLVEIGENYDKIWAISFHPCQI